MGFFDTYIAPASPDAKPSKSISSAYSVLVGECQFCGAWSDDILIGVCPDCQPVLRIEEAP